MDTGGRPRLHDGHRPSCAPRRPSATRATRSCASPSPASPRGRPAELLADMLMIKARVEVLVARRGERGRDARAAV
ncbi:hypothetical protein, partial [Isoptericola haloaureus]